jgi:hypothetical protein
MQTNIGITDRIIRVVAAMLLATLLTTGNIVKEVAIPAGIIAGLLLLTGFTGYCPLYKVFKINTRNKVKQNKQTL